MKFQEIPSIFNFRTNWAEQVANISEKLFLTLKSKSVGLKYQITKV